MKITESEWKDYYQVQRGGTMNMMSHPLIKKFMPDGNWAAAHKHFEEDGQESPLVIED